MKKTTLLCSILAACFSSSVFAGSLYIGPTLLAQNTTASHSNFSGIRPRVALGYAGTMDNYYLAAEFFVIPTTVTLSNVVNQGGVSTKTTRSYGASLLPGIMFNDKLLGYLRLGAMSSSFSSPKVMKTGYQAGFGLQTGLTKNWDLRGEYIYTAYSSAMPNLGAPKSNELGLGVIYRFDLTPPATCEDCF